MTAPLPHKRAEVCAKRSASQKARWARWRQGRAEAESDILDGAYGAGAQAALRALKAHQRRPVGPGRKVARTIPPVLRALIMERDDFRCRRCGHAAPEVKLVIDHIVPVALGGSGVESNLQTLCEECNAGKAGRPPHPHDQLPP